MSCKPLLHIRLSMPLGGGEKVPKVQIFLFIICSVVAGRVLAMHWKLKNMEDEFIAKSDRCER